MLFVGRSGDSAHNNVLNTGNDLYECESVAFVSYQTLREGAWYSEKKGNEMPFKMTKSRVRYSNFNIRQYN